MRGTRTIRRAAGVAALLFALAFVWTGCEPQGKRPARRQPQHSLLPSATPATDGSAPPLPPRAPLPPVIAQTLRSVREQRLEIAPSGVPSQRLAFGVGRLLQASDGRAVFRDTSRGEVIAESNLGFVHAVTHGTDGSLFALGRTNSAWLAARSAAAKRFPRTPFLPGSLLFADLEQPSHFFVFYPVEQQLYRYPLESGDGAFLAIEAQIPLPGCVGAPALLRDGAFVCRTASGLARKAPRGRRSDMASSASLGESFRLLPAKRLDELYSVAASGEVQRLRVAPGLPVLARFRLPAHPYEAAANGEALAFVLVGPPEAGHARRWTLLVTDLDGNARFQSELPAQATPTDDDWLKTVLEDKNLTISGFEALVAVGGAQRVTVWDYAEGQVRFAR